ncbi:hypothetical protein [Commensalibacter sp. Nvir]
MKHHKYPAFATMVNAYTKAIAQRYEKIALGYACSESQRDAVELWISN